MLYLHENQIVHRDIKPENILINEKNEIKLIDFGLSTYLSEDRGILGGGKTQVGDKKYVPPEVLYKEVEKSDFKGDIFCLGYTLFELMYLKRPTIIDVETLLREVNRELYNRKNIYDEDLVELVEDMFKYYIDDRPSAKEALDRLAIIEEKIKNNINNDINNNINNKIEAKRKEVLSVMKSILLFFSQDAEIFSTLNKALFLMEYKFKQKKLERIIKIKFTKKFKDILEEVVKYLRKEINEKDLDEKIKDVIIIYNNRQNNKENMPLPLKIFYDILNIINREMISLKPKTESYFDVKYEGLLKDIKKERIQTSIEKLELKKYESPFIQYFYYLLIPLTKCSKCENIFELFDPEIKLYLSLDNQKNVNIISDLVYNLFAPESLNKEVNCLGHKGDYVKQKFFLTNLPKYLVFAIKNQNEAIILNKILDMNKYTTSTEKKNCLYELTAIFHKDQGNNNSVLIKNLNDKKWISLTNNSLNIYDEISNIYSGVSLVIYKIKNN